MKRKHANTTSDDDDHCASPSSTASSTSSSSGDERARSEKHSRRKSKRKEEKLELRKLKSLKINDFLSVRKLVIVQGPFGCGKTHTIRALSKSRGVPLHILQINDQYDSKVLFGSYNCTEVPGEFVWQPSKFAQCLQQACILLLENIDHGGADLASSVVGLVESGRMDLPNGQSIRMHAACRIVATISLDEHKDSSLALAQVPLQLRDYPYTVTMPDLGEADFLKIMAKTAPRLKSMRKSLVSTFFTVSRLIRQEKTSMDRPLSSKDFFRAVARLLALEDLLDGRAIFLELLELWAMHLRGSGLRRRVAAAIGQALSLSEEEQNYFLDTRQPEVRVEGDNNKCHFGRATLERRAQESSQPTANFVLTRDSSQLLERLAVCIQQKPPEPVLLTGETGVGKTSAIQHLAQVLRRPLRVINLSQESEFSDLIGGYKPTSPANILRPLADDYLALFNATFDGEKNAKFLDNLNKCFSAQRFGDFLQLLIKSSLRAYQKFSNKSWLALARRAQRLSRCFGQGEGWTRRLLFAYQKGIVAEAAELGHWLLVDEINLASAECLDALVELLEPQPGDAQVHHQFRLFACMNHATDVGKRSLPSGLRSKFTELFVWETTEPEQLRTLIRGQHQSLGMDLVEATLHFYLDICAQFPGKFSLRSLSRAISIGLDQPFSCQRSCLLHGCRLAFSSQLGLAQRHGMLRGLLEKHFGRVPAPTLNPGRVDCSKLILIEGCPLLRGDQLPLEEEEEANYIFTPSVRANMAFLASVVATRRFPVLMEGETSAGKTSMIVQLARMSGNRCHRINNHEHTDIQEYIGTYAPDAKGRLQFVEGILLRAVREGDWIILDELNLAPSTVLEALNRLLDDNRELYVPELNATVRAHARFQLFATQNPVGSYAGRKRLSRAFLSRFMVIQCDPLPLAELPQIVHRRCGIAPSQAELMVRVLEELKSQRAVAGIFASSDGLMTLRDLFRWGNRLAALPQTGDWRQALLDQGFFVLATRCRSRQDERVVVGILEKQLNRRLDPAKLFGPHSPYLPARLEWPEGIVPTGQLRRMLVLCSEAWKCREPVLLVGETGCGKTTAVHLFGPLLSINCHERTDAADLLGTIRPVAGGGFCWQDGVVLQAMRQGSRLLIDEISLAPDSVLERLNSLLEPQRSVLLTDAGLAQGENGQTVTAGEGFQLVATMNPGNDHGKKELSKALRNRFTEVWCPQEHNREDLLEIIRRRLLIHGNGKLGDVLADKVAQLLVSFSEFFATKFNEILRFTPSTRDLVGLAELFMELYKGEGGVPLADALFHSIEANLLDALGVLPSRIAFDRTEVVEQCRNQYQVLLEQLGLHPPIQFCPNSAEKFALTAHGLSIGPFTIQSATNSLPSLPSGFSLEAPTTRKNALRLARALHSNKPLMLEGSPGAGKSSLVMALAAATGHKLVRLNLSEQTDLYDLFGSDIPVNGPDGKSISFAWMDGPVLRAIKEGSWVLLDEMNLASQSVLEGLNSLFDFRKNIFIAELNRTFDVDASKCRFFACQNPHRQGGDRRALPKSFLNRFLSIFIEDMTDQDFISILCQFSRSRPTGEHAAAAQFSDELLAKMILVNKLCRERLQNSGWGLREGGPFEFNLRDLFRWADAIARFGYASFGFELTYLSRLRSKQAREKVIADIYNPVFGPDRPWMPSLPLLRLQNSSKQRESTFLSIGTVDLRVSKQFTSKDAETGQQSEGQLLQSSQKAEEFSDDGNFLMATQMDLLEKLAACSVANWLLLLVGPAHCGKRTAIHVLAQLCGKRLERMRLTVGTDALDLLGSFEQIATERPEIEIVEEGDDSADANAGSNVYFEWVDSVFLRAYRDGHWLVVEDVNCCNAAVLDCLNSCLESVDGELVLPVDEARTIRRHPNFRIFFTMDPRNGQLSRAMRNRAVEVHFCTDQSLAEESLWSANIFDAISAIFGSCPSNIHSKCNSAQTHAQLRRLQAALSEHSTQSLLNCMAQLQAKMDWNGPINTEKGFQQALSVLLASFEEENENHSDDGISLNSLATPTEFPPLTRPLVPTPQNMAKFHLQLISYYRRCFRELSNNNKPDDAFFAVSTQIAKRMREFVLQEIVLTAITSLDELLEKTFPELEVANHVWKQLSLAASNETPEGQAYLRALRTHAECRPFQTHQQLKHFGQKWREERMFLARKTGQEEELNPATAFGPFQRHLARLLRLFSLTFANIDGEKRHKSSASLALLPWKSAENGQLFAFSQVMSAKFDESETLFTHLQTPHLTSSANQLLWAPLHYSRNILCQIRIGQLSNAHNELEQLLELFWHLTFSRKAVHEEMSTRWDQCQSKISRKNTCKLIEAILEAFEQLTPPDGLVDPPYFNLRQRAYFGLKQQKLGIYFRVLQLFLQLTLSKRFEFEQIASAFLQLPRSSPFFQSLVKAWHTTNAIMERLDTANKDYPKWGEDDEEKRIYRAVWPSGKESSYEENFRSQVLEPLRNCSKHLRTFFKGSASSFLHQDAENLQGNQAEYFCSQLSNCIQTIESLKGRICGQAFPPPIAIYPEMLIPPLFLLDCLKIALSKLKLEGEKALQEQRLKQQQITESNLHSFGQILSLLSAPDKSNLANLLGWTLQSQQLPAEHKLHICTWAFSREDNDLEQRKACLSWLFTEWEHWHEENALRKKEEIFVVKPAKSRRLENDEEEEELNEAGDDQELDELGLRAYLPDFSRHSFEEDSAPAVDEPEHLTGDELNSALKSIFSALSNGQQQQHAAVKLPFLSFMHIFEQFKISTHSPFISDDDLNFHQLCALNGLRQLVEFNQLQDLHKMGSSTTNAGLDVYKESDPSTLIQCLNTLGPLLDRCQQLLDEFPENAQLLQLKAGIVQFVERAPAGAPLMKHAAQLERILVQAEMWESISDRAHSIRPQMVPLQELLVVWRRREVQCWNELVGHVQQDVDQLALLVGWPLFKCALELGPGGLDDTAAADGATKGHSLLLMLLDWLQNSTLGDFRARLRTGRLLADCLAILLASSNTLSTRIRCICAHFEQFLQPVEELYAKQFGPIESELRDFTRVVHYTDLNLWSVKDSAKKAHAQLFRILRKFKEMCVQPLTPLLLDQLPKMPAEALALPQQLPALDSLGHSALGQKMDAFGTRLEQSTLELLDLDALNALREGAVDLLKLLQTELRYSQPKAASLPNATRDSRPSDPEEVDKANEKMQGRALFERQQRLAQLVRAAGQFGLTARRAQHQDSEALTVQTLTQFGTMEGLASGKKLDRLFRHAVASRNVFLRKYVAVHRPDQLSPSQLAHMRGILEFGLGWLFSALQALAQRVTREASHLRHISDCFQAEVENAKFVEMEEMPLHPPLSYRQMDSQFAANRGNAKEMAPLLDRMCQLLQCCPKPTGTSGEEGGMIRHMLEPLGLLRKGTGEHAELATEVDALKVLLEKVHSLHGEQEKHILRLVEDSTGEWPAVWHRRQWHSYNTTLAELLEQLEGALGDGTKLRQYFHAESAQLGSFLGQFHLTNASGEVPAPLDQPTITMPMPAGEFDTVQQRVLLRLQSVYKELEQSIGDEAMLPLDSVKRLLELVGRPAQAQQVSDQLRLLLLSSISSSVPPPPLVHLQDCATLAKGTHLLFERLVHRLGEFLCQLASFQANWAAIGCQLLAKGFVNSIPKPEPGRGEDQRVKDGCGFGEDEMTADAMDVTDELEAMEQIEGLKEAEDQDQQQSEEAQNDDLDQQQKLPEVDQPIDVDEEFAADLEGLDADERGEEEQDLDEGADEAEENRSDWKFGDVEEPEETQLDPKLWEPEVEEEEKLEEGGKEGAQQLTGELGAAQDEAERVPEGEEEKGQEMGEGVNELDDIGGDEPPSPDEDLPMDVDEQGKGTDGKEVGEESALEDVEEGEIVEEEGKVPEAEGEENDMDEQQQEGEQDTEEGQPGANSPTPLEEEQQTIGEKEGEDEAETAGGEQRPEAFGTSEGTPNAGQSNEEREKQTEKGTGGGGGTQNKPESHGQSAENIEETEGDEQLEEDEAERAEGRTAGRAEQDGRDEENGTGMEEEDRAEELEGAKGEEQKLSAHATSTREQARRTRSLFDSALRRVRKAAIELAEQQQRGVEDGQKEKAKGVDEPIELGEEDVEGAEGTGQDQQQLNSNNIFIQFNDGKQALDPTGCLDAEGDLDKLLIDRLCSQFDRLEQHQPEEGGEREGEDSERALQLKWALITDSVGQLAAELTESLRTVLEPTVANRLQGDYRTGKRLNMRRLIGYIASDYRKDRIWMRRTKQSKRNYQICIAVDNSQSMQHNHMTEITCNALCLIECALRQLEVGQLAVCSFGSSVTLLNDFASVEDPTLGQRILRSLKFDQQRTDLAQMLGTMAGLFKLGRERSSQPAEQMLIILGDGRGVLTEGVEQIRRTLDQLGSDRVTVLFLVLDTAEKSVTEMRIADFSDGGCTFRPYMHSFPFPLYALVKNTHSLPSTVAEAVRQWFEYTART